MTVKLVVLLSSQHKQDAFMLTETDFMVAVSDGLK